MQTVATGLRLNLGASDRAIPGYQSVDIVPPADQIADLSLPWPWEDNSVESVKAYDIIEHIGDCQHIPPQWCDKCALVRTGDVFELIESMASRKRHPLGRIHFMNELHRVLAPGAQAEIVTPNASRGAGFFQDPTHVTPWCLNSFQYFEDGNFALKRFARSYGITARFKIISLGDDMYMDFREEVYKITAILEAVK